MAKAEAEAETESKTRQQNYVITTKDLINYAYAFVYILHWSLIWSLSKDNI